MIRATMKLVSSGIAPGTWRLSEVQGPRNRGLPPNLIRCLAIWLAEKQRVDDEYERLPESLCSCVF